MDWVLYDNGPHHERVKETVIRSDFVLFFLSYLYFFGITMDLISN